MMQGCLRHIELMRVHAWMHTHEMHMHSGILNLYMRTSKVNGACAPQATVLYTHLSAIPRVAYVRKLEVNELFSF